MTRPRVYLACLWGASALFALYNGIAHRSAVAWWLLVALVPALIVFVWWMVDRAALERRIKRLEARSEIGDERRIVAHADLTKVEHKLHEIETRVEQVEDN
jgi:type VI protein secretion system component VasK